MSYFMSHPMLPLLYKMLGHFTVLTTAVGSLVAVDINFRDQITLGSIVVTICIICVAGIITIRSKIATIWREEAEGERAAKERLQEELNEQKLAYKEFEKQQQELRHDLKNKIAELATQLKVMEAKTDLSAALESINKIAIAQEDGHHQTHNLLIEIRDKLPSEPIKLQEPVIVKDTRDM